jgi:erythromycin esterase-like protein
MGYYLKADFQDDYTSLGFLFSKGLFTAMTVEGNQFLGLNEQTLEAEPKVGSLNYLMSNANSKVFTVLLSDLQSHDEWRSAFLDGLEYFHMGALYNGMPSAYYAEFDANFFDRLIYFDRTTASVQVE